MIVVSLLIQSSIPLLPGNVNPSVSPEIGTSTEELGHIFLPIRTTTQLYPLNPYFNNPFSKFMIAASPEPTSNQQQPVEQGLSQRHVNTCGKIPN